MDIIKVHGLYAAAHAFANADVYGKFVGVAEYLVTLDESKNLPYPFEDAISNIVYIISTIPKSMDEKIVMCSITLFDELRDIKLDEEDMPLPYGFVIKVRYYRPKANEFIEDIRLIGANIANPDLGITDEDISKSRNELKYVIDDCNGCMWWTDYGGEPHTVSEWVDRFIEHNNKHKGTNTILRIVDEDIKANTNM